MLSLIISIFAATALAVALTPREWLKNRILLITMSAFHILGISSIVALLFFVYKLEDGFFREAIIWTQTAYFVFVELTLILVIIRYCLHEIARHFNKKKFLRIINSSVAFYLTAILLSGFYLIPSTHNATVLKSTEYDISVQTPNESDIITIALCSDLHIGGGARHNEIDQMLTLINQAHPDLVLLPGDICDSSTSVSDLNYLKNALLQVESRLGIFYCPGNHEYECRENWAPYLQEAGVIFLEDNGIEIQDGINLIGRTYELEMSVSEILEQKHLDKSNINIVMQHSPNQFSEQDGISDLILCGHTHGYQFPFHSIFSPYTRKLSYGCQQFGSATVIVTSGISEWGYRSKWPSQSEVAVVKMKIGGNA